MYRFGGNSCAELLSCLVSPAAGGHRRPGRTLGLAAGEGMWQKEQETWADVENKMGEAERGEIGGPSC